LKVHRGGPAEEFSRNYLRFCYVSVNFEDRGVDKGVKGKYYYSV
jgi:hypothetical protein